MVMQIIRTVGKHKIPRFIYHMTNKSNYESMIKDGIIKTSCRDFPGVYAVELTNFFKRWGREREWYYMSLKELFIDQVTKGSENVIILKIPTAKLDSNKLFIRNQKKLWDSFPAIESGLHKQRKESLEYVYSDTIPISDVEKIGEVNIKTIKESADYNPNRPMRSIFTNLLKGLPEVKGAELLTC